MHTFLFILFHLVFAGGSPDGYPAKENKFVKVNVTLAKDTLQPGGKGRILVSFSPIDGIHINVDPPFRLTIEKNRFFSLHGEPDISTDKESGFLSTSAPIEQGFYVFKKANSGEHIIKGTIVYYFCSDNEGWCRKLTQPITLKLNIQKK
jgi:hypothetical protein